MNYWLTRVLCARSGCYSVTSLYVVVGFWRNFSCWSNETISRQHLEKFIIEQHTLPQWVRKWCNFEGTFLHTGHNRPWYGFICGLFIYKKIWSYFRLQQFLDFFYFSFVNVLTFSTHHLRTIYKYIQIACNVPLSTKSVFCHAIDSCLWCLACVLWYLLDRKSVV